MAPSKDPIDRLRQQVQRLSNVSSSRSLPNDLIDLGHALTGEPVTEHDCQAYQDTLPEYVEAELNGQPVRRLFPDLARHLDVCSTCEQMHVDLLETALAAESMSLPEPAVASSFDLSFLPPLSLVDQVRQIITTLSQGIMSRLNDPALPDLPAAARTLFRRLEDLNKLDRFQLAPDLALSFGAGLPPALQSVAATYAATEKVIHALSIDRLEAELGSERPSRTINRLAREAARSVGMNNGQTKQWAEQYVILAQANAARLLALAHQVANHDRTD